MQAALDSLYGRLRERYLTAFAVGSVATTVVLCAAAVVSFSIFFVEISGAEGLRLLAVAEGAVVVGLGWATWEYLKEAWRVEAWIRAGRPSDGAAEAWRTAVHLPVTSLLISGWRAVLLVALPVSVFAGWEVDLSVGATAMLFLALLATGVYPTLLNYFALELYLRPLLADIAERLPPGFAVERVRVPVRLKLLAALPLINLVTGVFVSIFSSDPGASFDDIGAGVIATVAVSLTVSLLLTYLLTNSFLSPVEELVEATRRVRSGDLEARAPLFSEDEFGALTSSFNEMLDGLRDRQRLREALGSYVAPEIATRVLEEGTLLKAQRVEATIVFVDIRDFSSFSEGRSPEETLARLTDFFELVVPIVGAHGGHANKFLGGGLLCVFGAPTPLDDHADRALAAASEVAARVSERYGGEHTIGVGINSGQVLAGTVGGGGRVEFTVIGDPVNVASRVERLTRRTGDAVLITEATRTALRYSDRKLTPRGEIPVPGRARPLQIYALGVAGAAPTEVAPERTAIW